MLTNCIIASKVVNDICLWNLNAIYLHFKICRTYLNYLHELNFSPFSAMHLSHPNTITKSNKWVRNYCHHHVFAFCFCFVFNLLV